MSQVATLIDAHCTEESRVLCKRWRSVNSGAWLRTFDDVNGVEKSYAEKNDD